MTYTSIAIDPCLPVEVGTEAEKVEDDGNIVILNVKTKIKKFQTARYFRQTFEKYWKMKEEVLV